jgi:hypothetical protein
MFSIRISTLALVVPFGSAVVFLLWFLWNLLRESAAETMLARRIRRRNLRLHRSSPQLRNLVTMIRQRV